MLHVHAHRNDRTLVIHKRVMNADLVKLKRLDYPPVGGLIVQQGGAEEMVKPESGDRIPSRAPDSALQVRLVAALRLGHHVFVHAGLGQQIGAKETGLVVHSHIMQPGELYRMAIERRYNGVPQATVDFLETFFEIARGVIAVDIFAKRITLEGAVALAKQRLRWPFT